MKDNTLLIMLLAGLALVYFKSRQGTLPPSGTGSGLDTGTPSTPEQGPAQLGRVSRSRIMRNAKVV